MNLISRKANLRTAVLAFALVIAATLSLLAPPAVKAAATLTETVDLATIREAAKGDGYVWSNRYKTMTFTNLRMETEDDYGFRFPSGTTLILNGNNYISAKLVAIAGQDDLKIKGNGTLTLVADRGIEMVSPELTSSLIIMDGKVTINAGSCGIDSEFPTVIVGETDLKITVSDKENGRAIDAYSVMLNHGTFVTDATILSHNNLTLGGCKLSVTAPKLALRAKEIRMGEGNKMKVGASADALSDAETYGDEACIVIDPARSRKTSMILGENFSVVWDYVILVLAVILLAAAIVLPILYKRRKDARKRAEVEARRAAEAKAKKEAAKAARRARYAGSKKEEP